MTKKYFTALANYSNWADDISIEWLNQINDQQWNNQFKAALAALKKPPSIW